jgi:hypothetical protein
MALATEGKQNINMPMPNALVDRALNLAIQLSSLPISPEVPENAEELAQMDPKELENEIKSLTKKLIQFDTDELDTLNKTLQSKGRKAYEDTKRKMYLQKQNDLVDKQLLLEQVRDARSALHQSMRRPSVSRTKVMLRAMEIGLDMLENGEATLA